MSEIVKIIDWSGVVAFNRDGMRIPNSCWGGTNRSNDKYLVLAQGIQLPAEGCFDDYPSEERHNDTILQNRKTGEIIFARKKYLTGKCPRCHGTGKV